MEEQNELLTFMDKLKVMTTYNKALIPKVPATLVIHVADPTTDFLKPIYSDRGYNVIRDHKSDKYVKDAISEHDRIIMMGHGSPNGLFSNRGYYVIGEKNLLDLRGKDNVYIWCYASSFVKQHNLSGFATGMFISEMYEAVINKITPEKEKLDYSNTLFTDLVAKNINYDGKRLLSEVYEKYVDTENPILEFNKERLYYSL